MEQYKDFAFVYDELMYEVDYNGWVKYIEYIIKNENEVLETTLDEVMPGTFTKKDLEK